jgi:hypothetical protein
MKLLCTIALLTMGVALPACSRTVAVHEDRYPNHLSHSPYDLNHDLAPHYRPTHRPYTSWHHRGNIVHSQQHDQYIPGHDHRVHDHRVVDDRAGVRVRVSD